MGAHIRQTGYAWNREGLSDIVFLVFDIANQGSVTWASAYVGLTIDLDLGNAMDDMVGYDSSRNLAYAWNATSSDADITGTPGLFGCRFLESPAGLTSFTIFTLASDPSTDLERYRAMAGLTFSGLPRLDGPFDPRFYPRG